MADILAGSDGQYFANERALNASWESALLDCSGAKTIAVHLKSSGPTTRAGVIYFRHTNRPAVATTRRSIPQVAVSAGVAVDEWIEFQVRGKFTSMEWALGSGGGATEKITADFHLKR